MKRTQLIAHRGSSLLAPENTLSAIEVAILQGFDGVELDLQQTLTEQLIILHDTSLERVAGLKQSSWEITDTQLESLDVGSWFSPQFKGEKIPHLAEVLKLVNFRVKINLEVKVHQREPSLVASLSSCLQKHHYLQDLIITSFNLSILTQIKQVCPDLSVGLILNQLPDQLEDFPVDLYSIHSSLVTKDLVERIHQQNKEIHVWTVNDPLDKENLINWGVDSIITDSIS